MPRDPWPIHHYFHGHLAGFSVRSGHGEPCEVIECLYACREGLDYRDFESLGKGMKVSPLPLAPLPLWACSLSPPRPTPPLGSLPLRPALSPVCVWGPGPRGTLAVPAHPGGMMWRPSNPCPAACGLHEHSALCHALASGSLATTVRQVSVWWVGKPCQSQTVSELSWP